MHLSSKISLSAVLLALIGTASLLPVQAQIYDAANDFEAGYLARQNPNGMWEYGWTQGLSSASSPLHLFTATGAGPDSPNEQNWTDPNNDIAFSPSVNYSVAAINSMDAGNNGHINVAANTLFATYGGNDDHSDANIVFVAPASNTYALSATFEGVQIADNADIHILANGVSLLNSTITQVGQTDSYSGNVFLDKGQTIDFAFGGNNDFTLHPANVGLSATLTPEASPVPEASTLVSTGLLLCLGFGGLALYARRRKASSAE